MEKSVNRTKPNRVLLRGRSWKTSARPAPRRHCRHGITRAPVLGGPLWHFRRRSAAAADGRNKGLAEDTRVLTSPPESLVQLVHRVRVFFLDHNLGQMDQLPNVHAFQRSTRRGRPAEVRARSLSVGNMCITHLRPGRSIYGHAPCALVCRPGLPRYAMGSEIFVEGCVRRPPYGPPQARGWRVPPAWRHVRSILRTAWSTPCKSA